MMRSRSLGLAALAALLCFACDDDDDGSGAAGEYSCQYDNKFGGFNCKDYIGAKWSDPAAREKDCGSGFVEENARVVAEPCPAEIEADGGTVWPAIGPCRVDQGGSAELTTFAYDNPNVPMTITACTDFQNGVWEGLPATDDGGDVHASLPEALDALKSTDAVSVSSDCADEECLLDMVANQETFDFTPVGQAIIAGLVFYPGGNVDPRAYAPAAFALAEHGVFVSIVPMESYLAFSGYTRADDVRAAHPEIADWFIAGHSLGGTEAAHYATTETGRTVNGVVIWDSVADADRDLSASGLPVLLLYTTENPDNNQAQVDEYARYLPEDTIYYQIEGANHSQFGYYEADDVEAFITREQQQAIAVEQTLDFIQANI